MIDDVVPRLRDLTTSMNECGFTGISTVVNLAADEIEQLRNDRAEAEPLLDELWNRRTEATEMRDEIKRLTMELANAKSEADGLKCLFVEIREQLDAVSDGLNKKGGAR